MSESSTLKSQPKSWKEHIMDDGLYNMCIVVISVYCSDICVDSIDVVFIRCSEI